MFDFCDVGPRVARMEAEAIDIEAEERRANQRIRQIGAQKAQQLKDLSGRAQVCTASGSFLARDVIYTSRAYATMSVSVCL